MIYLAPLATLQATPPYGHHHALHQGTMALVVVESWTAHTERHTWEALPGVIPFYPENYGQPVVRGLVDAFGASHGVQASDTARAALAKIGMTWHHCCP